MSVWMAAKQALTAVDLVTRRWARELALDECGVMVLILLGERGPLAEHELALFCGRVRQQVHRSLRRMAQRDLVRPAAVSRMGKVTQWAFTDRGVAMWRILERAINAWERTLAHRFDVNELRSTLERIAEVAVNRPGADGWGRGLLVPVDLCLDPIGARAQFEGLVEVKSPAEDDPTAVDHNGRTKADHDAIYEAWSALWRD